MKKIYEKPEIEVIDLNLDDPVMYTDKEFSDGWEWDEE